MTQTECQMTTDFCTGLLLHLPHKMDLILRWKGLSTEEQCCLLNIFTLSWTTLFVAMRGIHVIKTASTREKRTVTVVGSALHRMRLYFFLCQRTQEDSRKVIPENLTPLSCAQWFSKLSIKHCYLLSWSAECWKLWWKPMRAVYQIKWFVMLGILKENRLMESRVIGHSDLNLSSV